MMLWSSETIFTWALLTRMPATRRFVLDLGKIGTSFWVWDARELLLSFAVYILTALILCILFVALIQILPAKEKQLFEDSPASWHASAFAGLFVTVASIHASRLALGAKFTDWHLFLVFIFILIFAVFLSLTVNRDVREADNFASSEHHAVIWIALFPYGVFGFLAFLQWLYKWKWHKDWYYFLVAMLGWLTMGILIMKVLDKFAISKKISSPHLRVLTALLAAVSLIFIGALKLYHTLNPLPWTLMTSAKKMKKYENQKKGREFADKWRRKVTYSKGPSQLPNIVIVVMDTVRADAVGAYTNGKVTPFFDKTASEGILFENAYSTAPYTLAGHASLFTGTYSSINGANWEDLKLAPDFPTLAQILSWGGYMTLGISDNGWINPYNGLARGFKYFVNLPDHTEKLKDLKSAMIKSALWFKTARVLGLLKSPDKSAAQKEKVEISDNEDWKKKEIISWLNSKEKKEPYYLFLNYVDAHEPYKYDEKFKPTDVDDGEIKALKKKVVPNEFAKFIAGMNNFNEKEIELMRKIYDASVTTVDNKIAQIIDLLKKNNLLDNTILVITSDHGEYFGEYGLLNHYFDINIPVIKIPLLISYPPALPQGIRISKPVQILDIMPTILDLTGIRLNHDGTMSGRSLLSLLKGSYTDKPILAELMKNTVCLKLFKNIPPSKKENIKQYEVRYLTLVEGDYQYVLKSNGDGRLFKIPPDSVIGEDVTQKEPERAERMRKVLEQWIALSEDIRAKLEISKGGGVAEKITPAIENQLKALGYIQ